MGEDVEDVSGGGVDDRKSVDLVLDQRPDGLEQRRVGVDPDQLLRVVECVCTKEKEGQTAKPHTAMNSGLLTPPGLQLVLLQLLHLDLGALVIHLEDPDEVGDGEHADEALLLRVPERRGAHPVVDEGEEGLLDQELRVEDDQLGGGGDEIVALVEAEELDENLIFVALCKEQGRKKGQMRISEQ